MKNKFEKMTLDKFQFECQRLDKIELGLVGGSHTTRIPSVPPLTKVVIETESGWSDRIADDFIFSTDIDN